MPNAIGVARKVQVEGALPAGWRETAITGGSTRVLAFEGPKWVGARPARLVVEVETDPAAHMDGADTYRVVCRDRWTHPAWGAGVVEQSMYVDSDVAMAHDVYGFDDGDARIRVVLDCELSSLFAVEEDVIRIVDALTTGRSM